MITYGSYQINLHRGGVYDLPGKVNYIVEEGNSGIWHYRKWADGFKECWGKQTASNVSFEKEVWTDTNTYGMTNSEKLFSNYPFTFSEVPCSTWGLISPGTSGSGNQGMNVTLWNSTVEGKEKTNPGYWMAIRATPSTAKVNITACNYSCGY